MTDNDDIEIKLAKLVRTIGRLPEDDIRSVLTDVVSVLATMHEALLSLDGYVEPEEDVE